MTIPLPVAGRVRLAPFFQPAGESQYFPVRYMPIPSEWREKVRQVLRFWKTLVISICF